MKWTISPLSTKSATHLRVGTPPARRSTRAKITIVTALGWLLAWRPRFAMFLGRLVLRIWPGFGRAQS
jgi:hypothetical protein